MIVHKIFDYILDMASKEPRGLLLLQQPWSGLTAGTREIHLSPPQVRDLEPAPLANPSIGMQGAGKRDILIPQTIGCTRRGSYSAKGRGSAFQAPSKRLL